MSGFVQGLFWMTRGLGVPKEVSEAAVKAVGARIADAASDDGMGMRPLAKEYLALDTGHGERQVQRALKRLSELGILAMQEGTGSGRGNAPIYQISLDKLCELIPIDGLPKSLRIRIAQTVGDEETKGDNMSPFKDGKGRQIRRKRETNTTQKGDGSVSHYNKTTNTTSSADAREPEGTRPAGWDEVGADLQGPEGDLIRAALAANDSRMPAKLKPWRGRFRVAVVSSGPESGHKRIVVDGDEREFRSVFTGAMIHLAYDKNSVWTCVFGQRVIESGRAVWAGTEAPADWFEPTLQTKPSPNSQDEERAHGTA